MISQEKNHNIELLDLPNSDLLVRQDRVPLNGALCLSQNCWRMPSP
ncbi:hypothetical protein EVA_10135 [gut metagenome]|uniref:Uncharacterized protein n=1 Tax=gut metagenome TaxID=749906 RepID=J9CNQ8_9ZZZZ